MEKVKNISLIFIVSLSMAFGIGTERNFLNENVHVKMQQYSDWTIEDAQAGQDFYLLWAKDDQGKDHIYTWGENDYGQLADDTFTSDYTPKEIDYGGYDDVIGDEWKIKQIDVGAHNVMIVLEDLGGTYHLMGWGENESYELGYGGGNYNWNLPGETYYGDNSGDEITDVSTNSGFTIVSVLDSSGNNHFYTAGTEVSGELGNGGNDNDVNEIFQEISYSNDLESSSDYTVKEVFADGSNNAILDDVYNTDEASYIWTEDDQGVDHIYGAGGNENNSLLGEKSDSDHITSFTEINFNESSDIKIKEFYSSPVNIYSESQLNYLSYKRNVSLFYSGIVYTDSSNKDHLYTWGQNFNANLGNGSKSTYIEDSSSDIEENKLTDGSTQLPSNYTIDYVEANNFNNYALITDQDNNQQHIYFWGASRGEGLSTYPENNDNQHYKGDYYDSPVEINYPENLDLTTNRIINISGGFDNTFLLAEDDNQIQHLYIWGDNSNDVVSENDDYIINTPTLILNSINIINSNVEWVDENSINYTFIAENGNELMNVVVNDEQGNKHIYTEEDWEIIESDEYSTTYSLMIDDALEGAYSFDEVFYNSYFNVMISNSEVRFLIDSISFSYIWIIILLDLILILFLLSLLIYLKFILKKEKKELKLELEKDNYSS